MMQQAIFDKVLEQSKNQESPPFNLVIDALLTASQLDELTQFISTNAHKLPYLRLSLHVNKALLQDPHYQSLFRVLQKTALQKLELAFLEDELQTSASEITTLLKNQLVNGIPYPVIVCEQSSPIKPCKMDAFDAFNKHVINLVQQFHKAAYLESSGNPLFSLNKHNLEENNLITPHLEGKKIPLKALIKNSSANLGNIDSHITLEIQHTEVQQQEQVQEQIIDVAAQEQAQVQGLFDGQLIDFDAFQKEPYRSRVKSDTLLNAFQYELFGNMPKAIKFLSHEAAMQIAKHAKAFVALNADNLPQHFMLKKTLHGEMVLDYDADADEQKTNVFTPKEVAHYGTEELIYDNLDLPDSVKKLAAMYSIDTSSKQLDNVWVRYGDAGVQLLFGALGKPGTLSTFIIKHYLNRFPHWDRLLDDPRFLRALEQIKQFEPAEFTCFTEFLLYTDDTTQFNLDDILKGFDQFWREWSALAYKNKIDVNAINGRWSHKKIGNPLVYMERLLTILKNSRDLSEQLACLGGADGLESLTLILLAIPKNTPLPDIEKYLANQSKCTMIKMGDTYYLYGNKACGTGWGLTQLDAKIINDVEGLYFYPAKKLSTPIEDNSTEIIPFNQELISIYEHIAALGAHVEPNRLLDNYGAYYASKNEGFHVVSNDMGLDYDPVKQNALTFNPDSDVYRVQLEKLVECSIAKLERQYDYSITEEKALNIKNKLYLIHSDFTLSRSSVYSPEEYLTKEQLFTRIEPLFGKIIPYEGQTIEPPYELYRLNNLGPNNFYFQTQYIREPLLQDEVITEKQIIEQALRFIAQQPKGIPLTVYTKGLQKFINRFDDTKITNTIITSLFFLAHERYTGTVDVYQLIDTIIGMTNHREVIIENNRSLMKLFQQDIRLNDLEGYNISQRVALLNSAETDDLDKAHYIKKLFVHLQNNKYGTLKAIQQLAKNPNSKWPFSYALDTAEYFMKNSNIAGYYQTDLLLFCTLINYKSHEVYFEKRHDKHANAIHKNMEKVEGFLLKAATQTHPNNLDYAFKAIVQSHKYFTYAAFIAVCDEIEALQGFDNRAVETILTQHKFTISAVMPDVFSKDSDGVKSTIIQLLLALEMSEGNSLSLAPIVDASEHEIANIDSKLQAFQTLEKLRFLLASEQEKQEPTAADISQINQTIHKLESQIGNTTVALLKARQEQLQQQRNQYKRLMEKTAELSSLNIKELQERLNKTWKTKGTMLTLATKAVLRPILYQLKNFVIHDELSVLGESDFVTQLEEKIATLSDFKNADTFEKIDHIAKEVRSLSGKLYQIMRHNYFMDNKNTLTQVFLSIDYASYDYTTLFKLLDALLTVTRQDYAETLSTYISVSNTLPIQEKNQLLDNFMVLHRDNLPSSYIVKLLSRLPTITDATERALFLQQVITVFQKDAADPLLEWMLMTNTLTLASLLSIQTLTQDIRDNRAAIHLLFDMMNTGKEPILAQFLEKIAGYPKDGAQQIIEILAISQAKTPADLLKREPIDYNQLALMLSELTQENRQTLLATLSSSSIAITCLQEALKNRNKTLPFTEFLTQFEKAPFGKRDFTAQFDITQVERVVNSFTNLNSQSGYDYAYRKQMMEAFLFVNRAGNDLPVYYNKSAKDLTNAEIRALFSAIKSGELTHLSPFQTHLYALGLMREAMYRTTGQFPYSTQMIALIDCLMHEGDVISNIDTGQGKSIIDTMKATLLWLKSGRVDLTTASLIDAKRDLDIYQPFWSLLGVPFAKTPISSTSSFDAYEKQGINMGTMAQFALFYSKAKGEQVDLESEAVSLVMNESDYTILDDRTIYRYAATGGPGLIGDGKEWVYDAINQFSTNPPFTSGSTNEAQDIANLKRFLINTAKQQKKSFTFIDHFPDKKWLTLLESALLVNYHLKENIDYVVTEKPEPKLINGVVRQTRSAKIIMRDGKISPDTQYGNGMQQLLYSKLNAIHKGNHFVIEPESQTIISSNNKNMIDFYSGKKGVIWGSSATTGFGEEINLQYKKFGFEFSKVEPHQRNIAQLYKPVIAANEDEQFSSIIKQLQPSPFTNLINWFQLGNTINTKKMPTLVFFKNIETAKRFYAILQKKYPTQAMQLHTGQENENQTKQNAVQLGMITITTAALGRNTDFYYGKKQRFDVIDTIVSSLREERQRAGRTGRQGAPGNVYYILNQDDLGKRSIQEVREALEKKAEMERQFNEALYDILGALLQQIGNADKAFFKSRWSAFSQHVESTYRTEKLDGTYDPKEFLERIVTAFNQISPRKISVQTLQKSIDRQHAKQKKEAFNNKAVLLDDCIAPDIMAYHFVNPTKTAAISTVSKEALITKLDALFAAVNTKDFTALNTDYIAYLNTDAVSLSVIKEAHQEFLSWYLKDQVLKSNHTPFYKRWLGFEGHLNKVVGDSNYLLLFKAMMDVHDGKTAVVEIKTSIITLLEEYTQYSWFVSPSKRNAANSLITQINGAQDIDEMVSILSKEAIAVLKTDCDINRNSFWRKIKPVNVSGESRLQDTLDRALKLASVMHSKSIQDSHIDGIKNATSTTDKANAKVAKKSIESTLQHNSLYKPIEGMKGRLQKINADNDDKDKDNENSPT